MFTGGRTRHIPELLEPFAEVFLADPAQLTLLGSGAAISPWLPLHQYELDVILDDGIGLIRLAKKPAAIGYFVAGV